MPSRTFSPAPKLSLRCLMRTGPLCSSWSREVDGVLRRNLLETLRIRFDIGCCCCCCCGISEGPAIEGKGSDSGCTECKARRPRKESGDGRDLWSGSVVTTDSRLEEMAGERGGAPEEFGVIVMAAKPALRSLKHWYEWTWRSFEWLKEGRKAVSAMVSWVEGGRNECRASLAVICRWLK